MNNFPDIANFREVQDYSRRRAVSRDGDASNHCFTTHGSFRCYEAMIPCVHASCICVGTSARARARASIRICARVRAPRYIHSYVCLRNWHTMPRREICMYFTQRGVHFPLQSRACSTSNFASNYRGYLNTSQSTHTRSPFSLRGANMKAKVS